MGDLRYARRKSSTLGVTQFPEKPVNSFNVFSSKYLCTILQEAKTKANIESQKQAEEDTVPVLFHELLWSSAR